MAVLTAAASAGATTVVVDSIAEFTDSIQFEVVVGSEEHVVVGPVPLTTSLQISPPLVTAKRIGARVVQVHRELGTRGELVGDVQLTDDGITAHSGSARIEEMSGDEALAPGGVGGSTADFIASGIYNASFQYGTTAAISAATIVSGADSVADYEASLSVPLPSWVVGSRAGGGTFHRVVDAATVGTAAEWLGGADAEIFQDVPVTPFREYAVSAHLLYDMDTADNYTVTVSTQFLAADHSAISPNGAKNTLGTYVTGAGTAGAQEARTFGSLAVPYNARLMRLYLRVQRTAGSSSISTMQVNGLALHRASVNGQLRFLEPSGAPGPAMYVESSGILRIDAGGLRLARTSGSSNILAGADDTGVDQFVIDRDGILTWQPGGTSSAELDYNAANDRLRILNAGLSVDGLVRANNSPVALEIPNGSIEFTERTDPAAPAANLGLLYLRDNGSGKSQLVIRFNSGAIQVIATQP